MIEITDAAAEVLRGRTTEGKVIKLYKASRPGEVPNYALGLAPPNEKDQVFESKGIEVHMNPAEADEMQVAVVDYVNDERGRGFVVYAGQGDVCGLISCEECDEEIC
jgi:Fe-S cluster assembly iron-binding protein IscA